MTAGAWKAEATVPALQPVTNAVFGRGKWSKVQTGAARAFTYALCRIVTGSSLPTYVCTLSPM